MQRSFGASDWRCLGLELLADTGWVRLLLELRLRSRVEFLQLINLLGVGGVFEV